MDVLSLVDVDKHHDIAAPLCRQADLHEKISQRHVRLRALAGTQ